ncbi:MAG: hypothetical protein DCC58_18780, partial [Chloroflexi bacterium]
MRTALFSVWDKTGVAEFALELQQLGFRLISTGGTAAALREHGLSVLDVADVTGFPEILDGRVKTLHPAIHGGLLARRDKPEHLATLHAHGIETIDVLVGNLYPFERTVADLNVPDDVAIENIDIGGPAMLRAAAKNYAGVIVVVDPADYSDVIAAL